MATSNTMSGPSNPTRLLKLKTRAQKQVGEKTIDLEVEEHVGEGLNPHKVEISVKGKIDGACKGKINWDDTLKSITIHVFDVSIVHVRD